MGRSRPLAYGGCAMRAMHGNFAMPRVRECFACMLSHVSDTCISMRDFVAGKLYQTSQGAMFQISASCTAATQHCILCAGTPQTVRAFGNPLGRLARSSPALSEDARLNGPHCICSAGDISSDSVQTECAAAWWRVHMALRVHMMPLFMMPKARMFTRWGSSRDGAVPIDKRVVDDGIVISGCR